MGDSVWHEYIRLSIEGERWRSYGRLLHLVQMHADVGQHTGDKNGVTDAEGNVSFFPAPAYSAGDFGPLDG